MVSNDCDCKKLCCFSNCGEIAEKLSCGICICGIIFLIFHCFDRSISEPCPAGTYRPADQTECVPCAEGTFRTGTGAISCKSCNPGKQANSDKTQCGKCSYPRENRLHKYETISQTFLKKIYSIDL